MALVAAVILLALIEFIVFSLLGMSPRSAFPIMMGSAAYGLPLAGIKFARADAFDGRAALGIALGGIPGVLVAAYVVKSLPLEAIRWLVVVVVLYAGSSLLRTAMAKQHDEAPQLEVVGSDVLTSGHGVTDAAASHSSATWLDSRRISTIVNHSPKAHRAVTKMPTARIAMADISVSSPGPPALQTTEWRAPRCRRTGLLLADLRTKGRPRKQMTRRPQPGRWSHFDES